MFNIPVLTGPTAAGKTELSFMLAEQFNGEIINMDSRQIYRRLDIGTAKPSHDEMSAYPHHLIDIVDPGDRYTVDTFRNDCLAVIDDIIARGRLPIIVGGTPFYLASLLGTLDFCKVDADEEFRARMNAEAESDGVEAVHARLAAVDPESAEKIHPNDVYRVVRALEIFHMSGKPASEQREQRVRDPGSFIVEKNVFHVFVLYMEREKLYHLINVRAAQMFKAGLADETRAIVGEQPGLGTFLKKIIGYSQALDFLSGETGLETAIEETAKHTRRYAKRQLTWFRGMTGLEWLSKDSMSARQMAKSVQAELTN